MCSKNRPKIANYLKCYIILETDFLKLPLEEFILQCYEAGARAFQLRNKYKTARENYLIGLKIKKILNNKDALFIVNDRVDLAIVLEADGVHLGVKDIPAKVVKEKYPNLIIGYSCNTESDIRYANDIPADYIGIGPAFQTNTKEDLRPVLSKDDYINLIKKANMPAVAIGGIKGDNISNFNNIEIDGFAISSYICASKKPFEKVKEILSFYNG
ncbi:thiamine phosphate synthase [Deferribacter autotrophicus]|uniref:Thiamine-phosphate synthase n=1 Tax=Deferribacter autotrophicus TaxID=500465 RepID=A0A5A8F5B5_9BACT|nr:thiamine phosphate synthase [Deferribacter autotrophicus]KAA0259212.1 thiamine phosphate synthase [Deferribacter autotrophicus]